MGYAREINGKGNVLKLCLGKKDFLYILDDIKETAHGFFELHFAGFYPGYFQDIVNQPKKLFTGGFDPV